MANLELDSPVPQYAFKGDMAMLSNSPGHQSFTGNASPAPPEAPQSDADLFEIREHNLPLSRRPLANLSTLTYAWNQAKKGAVLCSHCSLIAHSKCAGLAALTCDLRSKLLMHAQFAERGNGPTEFFTRLPNHHPASATSSRGSLDRERTNSPQLSPTTSPAHPHPPVAYKVLAPFKRSHASISPDPTNSNSSVSLTPLTPEGNTIRRNLSIILTRQREPTQQQPTKNNNRPQSTSSIGSSCANSPQSLASQSPQSNSLRSLQAVVAATGNTTTNSSNASSAASRAARVDPSAATTTSSFVDAGVAVVALDAADPGASCVTVPDTAAPVPTVASSNKKTTRMMTMSRRSRGESSTGNCTIQ